MSAKTKPTWKLIEVMPRASLRRNQPASVGTRSHGERFCGRSPDLPSTDAIGAAVSVEAARDRRGTELFALSDLVSDLESSPQLSDDLVRERPADQESFDQLRRLVETGISLSSELSLESLLQRLIETAVELTEARYGALGVIDSTGRGLEQFITVGIDAETHAAIGDLPRGRGLLGAMIQNEGPLRLKEISSDSRSVGFPAAHPEMHSFLGVPIVLRKSTFGNLYLTEKAGGAAFTERDEEIVLLLAGQAAVAIENARLYEASRQWSRQLESLNEVSELLVAETDVASLFRLAADRLRELVAARAVLVERPEP